MNTQLAIANPQETDAQATLTFETATGAQTQLAVDVPARSRRSVDLSTVPELAGTSFSTRLDSSEELALDRLISLNADGAAASLETAVDQPATAWYFAEGSTVDPQELFYLVQNPGTTPANVRVRYLLPNGQAPVERTYSVAAGSRATIWVDREDPSLATTDVAAEITSVDGTPIVVERSLYLREAGSTAPRGGDSSTGVTAPATHWFIEGATGPYSTRLLLANPGAEASQVQVAYRRADGRTLTRSYTVAANSRHTVDVAAVHPSLSERDARHHRRGEHADRRRAHQVVGRQRPARRGRQRRRSTTGGARWLLAEGRAGRRASGVDERRGLQPGRGHRRERHAAVRGRPGSHGDLPGRGRRAARGADGRSLPGGRRPALLGAGRRRRRDREPGRRSRDLLAAAGAARTAGADGAATRLR